MKSNWRTQKGDEWLYESGKVRAAGDLYSNDQVFSVKGVSCLGSSLNGKQLMRLLHDTKEYFPEIHLLVNLHSSEPSVEKNLSSLQKKGFIGYQAAASYPSQVEVTYIKAKQWWSLW